MTQPLALWDAPAADVPTTGSLVVRVAGIPIPQGSMRGFVRGGRAVLTSDNPRLRSWRREVTTALAIAHGGVQFSGPVRLTVSFALPRPTGHFGRRGLLPSAPSRPAGARDDLDKLVRAKGAMTWRSSKSPAVSAARRLSASTESYFSTATLT